MNKIYSFNNIVMLVDNNVSGYMFWYLRNQRSRQANLEDLKFLLNYALFSKTGPESC